MQQHCKIFTDEDNILHAESDELNVIIMPDGEKKAFNRNAIKIKGGVEARNRCLVAELNGVRAYISNGGIILSTQDLYL